MEESCWCSGIGDGRRGVERPNFSRRFRTFETWPADMAADARASARATLQACGCTPSALADEELELHANDFTPRLRRTSRLRLHAKASRQDSEARLRTTARAVISKSGLHAMTSFTPPGTCDLRSSRPRSQRTGRAAGGCRRCCGSSFSSASRARSRRSVPSLALTRPPSTRWNQDHHKHCARLTDKSHHQDKSRRAFPWWMHSTAGRRATRQWPPIDAG